MILLLPPGEQSSLDHTWYPPEVISSVFAFGPTSRSHATSPTFSIVMLTLTSLPTGYVDESVPATTLIAFDSHATTFPLSVADGDAESLGSALELSAALALALALEVAELEEDPRPLIAENTHQISAMITKMMSTNASRRSQYTNGGSGPIGCMKLTSVTLP